MNYFISDVDKIQVLAWLKIESAAYDYMHDGNEEYKRRANNINKESLSLSKS